MNSSRNTVIRSLHDVGAAGWFGGSLMGRNSGGTVLLSGPLPCRRQTRREIQRIEDDGSSAWGDVFRFNGSLIAEHVGLRSH